MLVRLTAESVALGVFLESFDSKGEENHETEGEYNVHSLEDQLLPAELSHFYIITLLFYLIYNIIDP